MGQGMVYGSAVQVAALTKHTNAQKQFDDTTRPTLAQVDEWLVQVSSILDLVLLANDQDPATVDQTLQQSLSFFCTSEVAAMVEGVNGGGRFGWAAQNNREGSQERFAPAITKDATAFLTSVLRKASGKQAGTVILTRSDGWST